MWGRKSEFHWNETLEHKWYCAQCIWLLQSYELRNQRPIVSSQTISLLLYFFLAILLFCAAAKNRKKMETIIPLTICQAWTISVTFFQNNYRTWKNRIKLFNSNFFLRFRLVMESGLVASVTKSLCLYDAMSWACTDTHAAAMWSGFFSLTYAVVVDFKTMLVGGRGVGRRMVMVVRCVTVRVKHTITMDFCYVSQTVLFL